VRVQGAGRPERGGLGVLLGWATPWHVKYILSTSLVRVKGIRDQVTENVATMARYKVRCPRMPTFPWDEMSLT
jgi:hypothetical protein